MSQNLRIARANIIISNAFLYSLLLSARDIFFHVKKETNSHRNILLPPCFPTTTTCIVSLETGVSSYPLEKPRTREFFFVCRLVGREPRIKCANTRLKLSPDRLCLLSACANNFQSPWHFGSASRSTALTACWYACTYLPTWTSSKWDFFFCYRETPEACEKLGGLTGPPIVLFLHTRARSEFDASAIILGTGIFEEVVRG